MNKTLLKRLEKIEQAIPKETGIESRGLLIPRPLAPNDWARLAAAWEGKRQELREMGNDEQGDREAAFRECLAGTGVQFQYRILTNRGWLPCNEDGKLLNAS